MAKTITCTCPECGHEFEQEVIKGKSGKVGVLTGIPVEEMDIKQIAKEIINAKSVLAKATKRGAADDKIQAAQNRVDAALARRDVLRAEAEASKPVEEVAEVAEVAEVTETVVEETL